MKNQFQYLNSYYDKIYVLSVEAAVKRREQFAALFNGLEYSFFFGADKNEFKPEDIEARGIFCNILAQGHHRFNKKMLHGEIACSWSHKMIYEDMLANNYSRILIFEDDAVPDSKQIAHINSILREVPQDCELLMWGWDKNDQKNIGTVVKQLVYHLQHKAGRLKWNHNIIRNLHARAFSKYLKKAGFHDYTYAYAITRSAAEKLVAMQTPIQYIADNLLAHSVTNEVVNGYIVWPAVFLHDSLPDGRPRDSYIR